MKKKSMGIALLLSVCLITTIVYGALSGNVELISNKTTVNPGDEITLTLKVSNIEGTTTGVAGFESKLDYDASVFEIVETSDITSSWTVENVNPATLLSIMTTNPVTTNTNICTIKLKVKENAEIGSTSIGLPNATIFNLEETNSVSIAVLTINVEEVEKINQTNNTTNNTINNTTNNQTIINANIAKTNLPKTGMKNFIIILISISFITSGISYMNYLKNKNV